MLSSQSKYITLHIAVLCCDNKYCSVLGDAVSDQDSDASDAGAVGDVVHLPRRVLRAEAEVARTLDTFPPGTDDKEVSQGVSKQPARKKKKLRNWRHRVPNFTVGQPSHAGDEDRVTDAIEERLSPLDCFQRMFPKDLLEHILEQTNLYGQQRGQQLNITMEELLGFIGVMLMSGYRATHDKKHLWSNDDDVSSKWAKELMARNRFLDILRNIHLADNTKLTTGQDPYFKVRPFFEKLNLAFKSVVLQNSLCVDESMVPYYGRHGTKQFIRGKPVRYGYKLWCLASSGGYLYHAEPYCGSSTDLPLTGMGQGADVVTGLLDKCSVSSGTLYFDNLFISLELLDELTRRGIGGCGTVRENRLRGIPFSEKRVFERKERGAMEWMSDGENVVVRWNDNRMVTVATNCISLEPSYSASRYVKKEGGRVQISMPAPFYMYNKNMGGVDLFDQSVATYRSSIRSKKWWWPLFQWGVDAARTNAWLLSRGLKPARASESQLPFLRELTKVLIKGNTVPRPPAPYSGQGQPPLQMRFDGLHHWPKELASRYHRCKLCERRTNMSCEKCEVPMHPQCMKLYHTRTAT